MNCNLPKAYWPACHSCGAGRSPFLQSGDLPATANSTEMTRLSRAGLNPDQRERGQKKAGWINRHGYSLIGMLLVFVGFFGCEHKNNIVNDFVPVLKIDPTQASESINLSDLVDSVYYINLETNTQCIMGRITQLLIKRKYIYVADVQQDMVFVFDKKGQFVSRLDRQGRGEGEYVGLGSIFVDESEAFLEVLEWSGKNSKRLIYTISNFDLVNEELMYIPSASSCRKLDSFYYFTPQQIDNVVNGKPTNADVIIVNATTNTRDILFDKNIFTGNNNYSFYTESFTMNEEGELFVSLMFDQTFYQLSGWEATPVMAVDFGEYSIDNTIGLKSTEEQLRYFREEASNRAYFPVLTAHTEKLLAIFYTYAVDGGMGQQYIHLKDRNQIFHTQKIVDDVTPFTDRNYFCSSSIPFNHEIVYDENYLVDIVLPSQYLKDERSVDIEGIGKITDQDNPIVLLMKLKE